MSKYKRIFIVLAILLSGVSILPAWATPWSNFNWQKFADAYRNPTKIPIPTATPTDDGYRNPTKIPVPTATPTDDAYRNPTKIPIPTATPTDDAYRNPTKIPIPTTTPTDDAYRNPTKIPVPTATRTDEAILLLPDLVIEEMRIETELGGSQCSNSPGSLGIRVWVLNQGYGDTGPFLVEVNGARKNIDGLASEMSQSIWFEGYLNGKPNLAIVDVKDQVKESNEDNNIVSQMLPVPTPVPTCTPSPPTNTAPKTPTPTWEAID